MSRQRKRDAVLRLLRGEDLETVSRALGVTAAPLSGWRDAFLAAGEASLATRPSDGEALESERLKARLGEMLLERELLDRVFAGSASMNDPLGDCVGDALALIGLGESITAARAALTEHSALLVTDEGKPVAVITRQDLLTYATA